MNGLIAGGLVLIGVVVAIPARSRVWVLVYMAMALLGVAIWNMVLIHKHGQTLGKRIVGIRMVRSDGSRVSLGRVIGLRILPVYVMQLIPFIGPFVSLADVLFVFRDSRKCIHDNLADTIVVNA